MAGIMCSLFIVHISIDVDNVIVKFHSQTWEKYFRKFSTNGYGVLISAAPLRHLRPMIYIWTKCRMRGLLFEMKNGISIILRVSKWYWLPVCPMLIRLPKSLIVNHTLKKYVWIESLFRIVHTSIATRVTTNASFYKHRKVTMKANNSIYKWKNDIYNTGYRICL